jgi:NDP-sugar pyrophosphorylase family protein
VFVLNGDVLTDADLTAMRRFTSARLAHDHLSAAGAGPAPVRPGRDRRRRPAARVREKPTADETITTNTINAASISSTRRCSTRIPLDAPARSSASSFPRSSPTASRATAGRRRRTGATSATRRRTARPRSTCCTGASPAAAAAGQRATAAGSPRALGRPDAQIVAPSVIGAGATLGAAPRRAPAVVGDGAAIGADAA